MARNYRYAKSNSKYKDDAIIVNAVVSGIEEVKKYPDGRVKTAFKCKSVSGDDRLCIFWSNITAQVGDLVSMKGRFKEEVFLVWSLLIVKKVGEL